MTVLELGTFFAAPFGGTVLREVGARVIKVEPLEGEPMRGLLPFPEVGGAKCVQGKESICVDLSSEEGRAIVHALARKSDIVLQSFRAGVAKRQGVDAETLRAVNPGLVYLNSPGYGIDGPCGDRPAYAPTIGAGSGLVMRNIGTAIEERPGLSLKEIRADALRLSGAGTTEYAQADGISALTAASAMALGLLVRDRTGVSQEMLTTMLTSTAHALADDMAEYKDRPPTQAADAELLGYSALYRLYRAADEWIYLAAPSAGDWYALCTALIDEVDLASRRNGSPTARRGGPTTTNWPGCSRTSSHRNPPSTGRTRCWLPAWDAWWRTASRPRASCSRPSSPGPLTCWWRWSIRRSGTMSD